MNEGCVATVNHEWNFFGSANATKNKVFLLQPKIFGSYMTRTLEEGLSEITFSVQATRLAFKNSKFRMTENANGA